MTVYFDHERRTPISVQHGYIFFSSAAQRSAVPCLALHFAVLRGAALCVFLNTQQKLLVVVPCMIVPGMI